MTSSLLLYIFPIPRNRKTHQSYTPPWALIAIYPSHNKLLFDHKDLASREAAVLLVSVPSDGNTGPLP